MIECKNLPISSLNDLDTSYIYVNGAKYFLKSENDKNFYTPTSNQIFYTEDEINTIIQGNINDYHTDYNAEIVEDSNGNKYLGVGDSLYPEIEIPSALAQVKKHYSGTGNYSEEVVPTGVYEVNSNNLLAVSLDFKISGQEMCLT